MPTYISMAKRCGDNRFFLIVKFGRELAGHSSNEEIVAAVLVGRSSMKAFAFYYGGSA
jgi:hypothetical protein